MKTKIIFFITALWFSGCTGSHPLHMYTLSPKSPAGIPSTGRYRHNSIMIEYPRGLENTMGTHIYYTQSDLKQSYYLYNQWSKPLNRIVMANFIALLQKTQLFAHVLDYASTVKTDYVLETVIQKFEHKITEKGSSSEIAVELRLLRNTGSRLVKSRRFIYSVPCETTDAHGFVKAADKAMEMLAKDMLFWLSV